MIRVIWSLRKRILTIFIVLGFAIVVLKNSSSVSMSIFSEKQILLDVVPMASLNQSPRDAVSDEKGLLPEDTWLRTQAERKARIRQVCSEDNIDGDLLGKPQSHSILKQLKVDDKHKVIYCYVPKAACTSWKSMFVRLSGDVDPDHPESFRHKVHYDKFLAKHGIKQLGGYSQKGITERLQNYSKFIVVRHPFLRLLSAFQDKFRVFDAVGRRFQKHWGRQIIQRYRSNPSKVSLTRGQNATFGEFLRYLGDDAIPYREKFEPHWKPLQNLCHPCLIDYDYVAKTETLEEDSSHILDRAFNTSLRLQNLHVIGRTNTTDFDTIPDDVINNLYKHYGSDLKMFGYEWPLVE